MRYSVVIPAHNEQALIARCLGSVRRAVERDAAVAAGGAEVVVVANRCTDHTAELAEAAGARVVVDERRNIAAVRNAGVAISTGEVVVTIDADTVMHPDTLVAVERLLASGAHVGGGCSFVPERTSWGIRATMTVGRAAIAMARIGGVVYWCRRADFDAIGGFDQAKLVGEDIDFARRLRRHGATTGRSFTNLSGAPAVVSCRKFDTFGDWHMFTGILQARAIRGSLAGSDTRFVDEYFFDFNDRPR